ncbi:S26 family signal peptidase [Campylobacter ureolyticus]|uniref:S26 family signal peptidase n=1 Tax=Campylobacter ureolyticus TaxID=827 RepID=UPI0022B3F4F6|nr:S26 family signal peptidase [Campylobacter ureolyticus]MCZ6168089.1 S26 family signal peptidase [Campylobacter ureolyticus]
MQPNEIFVMGDHKRSFDSRYFGIINTNDIKIQKVREILTCPFTPRNYTKL